MRIKRYYYLGLLIILFNNVWSQTPILLTDQTIKLTSLGEEYFYYGFHEGDKVQLDFEELKKKKLKEIEIKDYRSGRIIYADYEIKHLRGKQFEIPTTGIYQFRFYNASISKRIGKIKISRIPIKDKEHFNSTVYWGTKYDTIYKNKEELYLERIDTNIVNLTKKVVKVNSIMNQNGNRQYIYFSLPTNTVRWSYYVGVGQKSQEVLETATSKLAENSSSILMEMSGYGPLAALALGGISYITQLQKGEDVEYYLLTKENVDLLNANQSFRSINKGKVINDFTSYEWTANELLYFYFINDNAVTGITVNVDITAITAKKIWNTRTIKVPKITEHKTAYLKN